MTHPPARFIEPIHLSAVVLTSAAATARAFNREYASINPGRGKKSNRRSLAASVELIGLARSTVVGLLGLALSAFIGFGGATMMFGYSLRPQFFDEHQARLRHDRRHHEAVSK